MAEIIPIGEVAIAVTRKDVKYVHLSVHPPMGHVTLVAPSKPARRWPGPTPSPSSAGFVISRRRCADRRERHPANLSNGRATTFGGGDIF